MRWHSSVVAPNRLIRAWPFRSPVSPCRDQLESRLVWTRTEPPIQRWRQWVGTASKSEQSPASPNPGNSRPRVFRLTDNRALINRMGFPGAGVDAVAMNLVMRRKRPATIGINIGPNKESVEAGLEAVIADCQDLVRRLASLCTYLVLNVSSPNTAKLRDLQGKAALAELLTAVRSSLPPSNPTPLFVKIAPDLTPPEIDDIIDVVLATGLSGVVATNTTSARPPFLKGKWRNEIGGLSGEPLRTRSLDVIRQIATATKGTLPIIGVGGIASGADALCGTQGRRLEHADIHRHDLSGTWTGPCDQTVTLGRT